MKETRIYKGIVDCHGIESFVSENHKDASEQILFLRAESNRQRHAIFYKVELLHDSVKLVNKEINAGHYVKALNLLKKVALKWYFPKGKETQYNNSLDLIPNEKLDPWR